MIYLLDSNVCIRYLNGRSPKIIQKLQTLPTQQVAVCSVVKAELFFGAMKSQTPAHSLAKQQRFFAPLQSFPFDDKAATEYGRIRAELTKQGIPIGPNDFMIAAIALVNQLTLVTHNIREFNFILQRWGSGSIIIRQLVSQKLLKQVNRLDGDGFFEQGLEQG